jgi:hypothetical protein
MYILLLAALLTLFNDKRDILFVKSQNYCLIGKGIFDSTSCFTSAAADLANCCFQCLVRNTSGEFTKCGSLLEYGGLSMADTEVIELVKQLCGGVENSFVLQCDNGNDQSQYELAARPSNAPTRSPSSIPTKSPTAPLTPTTKVSQNNASSVKMNTWNLISLFVVALLSTFV